MNMHKIEPDTAFTKEKVSKEKAQGSLIKVAEKLMVLVGVLGQTLYYFQAYKIYSVGSAKDVSGIGFGFSFFSLVCWLLYGILIKNKVLIIVNIFAIIGASLTFLAIFLVS
ncbi:MAG: hypothetical protein K0R76_553 [Alphaproteobacteria bacterium]|jgi:MtN3 and saliva related transmembrane protein|nr:hypothetical protein [Alphaproteobacteria bacterium]MDF3033599.1 hypothetical protein [Alphaproteobacteria bacterium]